MIFTNKTRLNKTHQRLMASAAAIALLIPAAVEAQQITSAIEGVITTPTGSAASDVTVTIRNTNTGLTRTVTTGTNGSYNVRNLPVGDPYSVTVAKDGYETQTITGVYVDVSGSANLAITLTEPGTANFVEEIIITASSAVFSFKALGPNSVFNQQTIRNLPSISRDVNDIIRLDPRVQFQGQGVSCLGANNNFNAFTIDGVRSGDGFGLNGSGNLARNTFPIPFDSIGEASVEFAPIDVQYGSFSGCQINVVTQKGTNEFHGDAFFLYNNQGLSGDELDGEELTIDDFDRFNWGANFGGPIIKDKLFFYVAYEEFSTANIQQDGPEFLNFAEPLDTTINGQPITQADLDRFSSILVGSYGRDAALQNVVSTLPQTNRRFFGRLDWNISDSHRLEATYARLDESQTEGDGIGDDVFTFEDSFEIEGTRSDAISVRLYSDWTDRFSTDVRISRQAVTDLQGPVGGGEAQLEDIPRIAISLEGPDGFLSLNPFFGQGLTSGPGIFRSANQLDYTTDQIRVQANYVAGTHDFTGGYELDSLEVFNLFIVNATGTLFFDSLDSLEAGQAAGFQVNGSFTGDPVDAAASFTRDIHALYLQDKWQVTEDLEIIAGLRYEWYDSGDAPLENPIFQQRYGFSNARSFDGLNIFLPRFGVNYQLPEKVFGNTNISAGVAVFSTAGPTVWFANSFQNFGGAIGFADQTDCTEADRQVLQNGQFTGLPSCLRTAAALDAQANTGRADALDPDFILPSQTRFNLSLQHYTDSSVGLFDGWDIRADFIYSVSNNEVEYFDLTLTPLVDDAGNILTTPDGRVRQNAIDPLLPGCNAVFQGPGIGFANVTPACDSGGDDQDILLTNSRDSGRSINASIQLAKEFQLGDVTALELRGGYAFSDVTLSNTGQNSTALSGFENTVRPGPNQPVTAPAVFQNAHAFTLAMTLSHEFIEDHETTLSVFWSGREGSPFSYVFDDNTAGATFGDSDNEARILPYIPTGPDDPLVDFSGFSAEEQSAFFTFLEESGLNEFAGQVAPRNSFRAPWNMDIDLRFQQEIPGFFGTDKFRIFIDLENALNFISSTIGVQQAIDSGDVPEGVPLVRAFLNEDNSQYVYSRFFAENADEPIDNLATLSLWRVNLGIRYEF